MEKNPKPNRIEVRVTNEMKTEAKALNLNIAEICRQALYKAILKARIHG